MTDQRRRHHDVHSRVAGEVGFDVGPQYRSVRQRYLAARRRPERVSKWDRPPEPRDWRFFVGTLGRILISIGVLMFGFVAYQLWGTGLETARAQSSLGDRFEAAVTNFDEDAETEASVPADTGTDDTGTDVPSGSVPPTEPGAESTEPGTPAPVSPSQDFDLTAVAVDQDIPDIIPGQAFARLELPKIGKDLYVVPGVGVEDLKKGPGHYPDTPLPGQLGNASIAGHRTTFGEPFIDIDRLEPGDQMIVTMITGDRFIYEVTGTQIVTAADYWVVTTTDPTIAELTLTSCHPKYTARDRIVVKGILVPELSDTVGVAEFYDLSTSGDDAPIPGDDPTFAAPTDDPATDDPATDDPATDDPAADDPATDDPAADDPGSDDAATDEPAGPTATVPPADDGDAPGAAVDETSTDGRPSDADGESADAFSRGWFDDRDAWPQIALWGTALTIIAILAYRLSRRTRHDSIGFAVGIAPFLVSLYFFFQNVNRLLPPGL